MNRNTLIFSFVVVMFSALAGCSSKTPAGEANKAQAKLDQIQGRAQVLMDTGGSGEGALNPGKPPVTILAGMRRYRLYSRKPIEVNPGSEYIVEGIDAQKVIDEIGDPDEGKSGYPLTSSCERVVKMAWGFLSFDERDSAVSVLRSRVARYPARSVFLVVRIRPATSKESSAAKKGAEVEEKDVPTVAVAAEKQRPSLVAGSLTQPTPLWEPAGRTVKCKLIIDREGKVSELETGAQLCEAMNWSQIRYQPLVQGGHPVNVRTEVEVQFEPRKKPTS